ncbi:MFS transporter [Variovorax robiniae]|uniref:MFS transporter n=1 Tax=Variovorax robiniae TaxID=1836199 RepID=A0ABU8XL09_9BURK
MTSAVSTWQPLRSREFRAVFFGVLCTHTATWVNQVGAATLMSSLTPVPLMTALVQTAASLPVVLLGLPAGAIADLVDRRLWMRAVQFGMLIVASLAFIVSMLGGTSPVVLLVLTMLVGAGLALQAPAAQAVYGEVVPREELTEALALGSMSFNLSRVLGPALAGVVLGMAGATGLYATLALCSALVLVSLTRWRSRKEISRVAPERLWSALRGGLRYVRHSPDCHRPLLHTFTYTSSGSAAWALLPVLARDVYGLGAQGYGLLLGSFGLGGLVGVLVMGRVRQRWPLQRIMFVSTAAFAAVTAILAMAAPAGVTLAALLIGGTAWMIGATLMYTALQDTLPGWVRARGLSFYNLIYFTAMAGGAAVWGILTGPIGTRGALGAAALCMGMVSCAFVSWPLRPATASLIRATAPLYDGATPSDRFAFESRNGPLMVQISYRVRPECNSEFLQIARDVGLSCRRNGAIFWRLFREIESPELYVERYMLDSWLDHTRHLDRTTATDRELRERLARCLIAGSEPLVRHQLVEDLAGAAVKSPLS